MSNYTLIKGTFHVVGFSPDGDSLMFRANNPKNWEKFNTTYRDIFNDRLTQNNGAVQLRLQGIDALETHYSPSSISTPAHLKDKESDSIKKPKAISYHQPEHYADKATTVLLNYLGVNKTEWASRWGHSWIDKAWIQSGKKEIVVDDKLADAIPGYIITRDIERKGRPISWVFAGKTRSRDGAQLTKSKVAARIERSGNYHLLEQGVVYPYFFMTLPATLRSRLIKAVDSAQDNAEKEPNLWSNDRSTKGVTVKSVSKVTGKYELYPYLFRKLIKHAFRQDILSYWDALENNLESFEPDMDAVSLSGFFDGGNPYIFLVTEKDFVKLESVLSVTKTRMTLKTKPQNIVFLS